MKITQVLQFFNFYELIKDKKLPMRLAYRLAKLKKQVDEEQQIYREQIQSLIQTYAEKNEQGLPITTEEGGVKLVAETQQECLDKLNELDNLEINLDFEPFNIDDFADLDLTIDELQTFIPFLAD